MAGVGSVGDWAAPREGGSPKTHTSGRGISEGISSEDISRAGVSHGGISSNVPTSTYVRPAVESRRKVKTKDKYGRNTSAVYRRLCRELKASAEGGICHRCGQEIDRDLPPSESNSPAYWTADHVPSLANGGTLLKGLVPAHRGCNSSAGRQEQIDAAEIEYSREW